jgi:hypothetical protein
MRTSKILFATTLIGIQFLPACSLFQSACQAALPSLTQAQAYASEAAQALEQAAIVIDVAQLGPDKRAAALSTLDRARAALRAAQSTVAAASGACTRPDVLQVFHAFVLAWHDVRAVLAALSPVAGTGAGARPPTLAVSDPLVYVDAYRTGLVK